MTTACPLPESAVAQTVAVPGNGVLAGFRERLSAALLDVLIFSTAVSASALLLLHTSMAARAEIERMAGSRSFPWFPAFAALGLFYAATFVCEWAVRATPGKLLCRLRVKTLTQPGFGFVAALVRAMVRPVDTVLGPILMLTSPGRQRLGDRIAGTVVVIEPRGVEALAEECPVFATWEERAKASIVDSALLILLSAAYLVAGGSVKIAWPLATVAHPLQLILLIQLWWWYFLISEGLRDGAAPLCHLCSAKPLLSAEPPFARNPTAGAYPRYAKTAERRRHAGGLGGLPKTSAIAAMHAGACGGLPKPRCYGVRRTFRRRRLHNRGRSGGVG